jgi:transposase-like protein
MTTTTEALQCDRCDFEHPKIVGRARWHCPKCGRDYSIEYLFWAEAAHPEWFADNNVDGSKVKP